MEAVLQLNTVGSHAASFLVKNFEVKAGSCSTSFTECLRTPFFGSKCTASLRNAGHSRMHEQMRVTRRTRHSSLVKVCANLGPFGARDAKPEELESNFSDKAVGLSDTEHKILLPQSARDLVGLAGRTCAPLTADSVALTLFEAKALLRKVLGWKLAETPDGLRLRGEWKLRSFAAGLTLFERIAEVAEAVGHHPDLHLERSNRASVDIWSHSVGGVTEADFVLAAKIDQIFTGDLVDKKKFWA